MKPYTSWFFSLPKDPNFFFSAKTSASQDMQLALDKAIASARGGISKQVEAHVKTLEKRFIEEVGAGKESQISKHFATVIKVVSKTTLVGSKVNKQKVCENNNGYQAYVLMEYAIGAANKALLEQLNKNKALIDEYKATKAYKELDEETKDL